jgi:guanylate kinase
MISVFIISAPSGSGKSTLVHRLLKTVPNLAFSISYSTRPRRPTETDGVDYKFISREDFEARLGRGEFLEHAEVFGNYYGTNREAFEAATREGKDLVLDIDIQGARQLRTAIPQAITIFVLPPSKQVMEQRLRSRSQDSEEVIQRRLQGAAAEVKNYTHYDFVLINRDIEEASAQLVNIVEAERLRRARMEVDIRPILESFEADEQDDEDDKE